ncbi:MAG: hypothetical protein M3299_07525 [Thermoproteota archaeon]|nr:hypothetical protein [Thermoproteota archaeon]
MHIPAFSKKIISTIIIGSILVIFGYSEAYGQTTMASTAAGNGANGGGNTTTTGSDIIDCLVNICENPDFQLPSNTSVIAMAIVNLTLTDIQEYKEVLKSEISHHINDTIDNLASGVIYHSQTCAPPPYHNELPCPLIIQYTIPPLNLTLLEELSTTPLGSSNTSSVNHTTVLD